MVEKPQIAKSVVDDIKFERVHRMGAKTNAYSRNIVAKFTLYKDRETVKRHRFNLRGTQYSTFEQFPREINERRKKLLPKLKDAKSRGQQAWIGYDTMYINGKPIRDVPQ